MKIKLCLVIMTVAILSGAAGVSYGTMCHAGDGHGEHGNEAQALSAAQDAADAGNKVCPVTGDPVDGKTNYVYEGKRYNFCCPMCIDAFKKNPKAFIKKIEQR